MCYYKGDIATREEIVEFYPISVYSFSRKSIWHIFDVNTDSSYSATLKKHMFLGFTMVTILYVKFFVLYVFPIVIASHDSKFDDKIGECK